MASWRDESGSSRKKSPTKSRRVAGQRESSKQESKPKESWQKQRGAGATKRRRIFIDPNDPTAPVQFPRVGAYALFGLVAFGIGLFIYAIIVFQKPIQIVLQAGELQSATYATSQRGVGQLKNEFSLKRSSNDSKEWVTSNSASTKSAKLVCVSGYGFCRVSNGKLEPVVDTGERIIPVRELINAQIEAEEKRFVLALDVCRGRPLWEKGQLCNLFPGMVEDLVAEVREEMKEKGKSANLTILLPCDDGQRDWLLSPEYGNSFLRNLAHSLTNEELGKNRFRHLGIWRTISTEDLGEHLSKRISDASSDKLRIEQSPIALSLSEGQILLGTSAASIEFDSLGQKVLSDRMKKSHDLWRDCLKHDKETLEFDDETLYRAKTPLLLAEAWKDLSQVEIAILDGPSENEEQFNYFKIRAANTLAQLQKKGKSNWSLSIRRSDALDKLDKWSSLVELPSISREDLRAELSDLSGEVTIEQRYAKLLEKSLDWDDEPDDPAVIERAVLLAIKIRDLSERLVNFADPRVFAILYRDLEVIEKLRRRCDDLLIANEWEQAESELNTLLASYQSLMGIFRKYQDAFEQTDRFLDYAPWYGEWLIDDAQLHRHYLEGTSNGSLSVSLQELRDEWDKAYTVSESLHLAAANGLSSDRTESSSLMAPADDQLPKLSLEASGVGKNLRTLMNLFRAAQNPALRDRNSVSERISRKDEWDGNFAGTDTTNPDMDNSQNEQIEFIQELATIIEEGNHPLQRMLMNRESNETLAEARDGLAYRDYLRERSKDFQVRLTKLKKDAEAEMKSQLTSDQLAKNAVKIRCQAWLLARILDEKLDSTERFWEHCLDKQREWLAERSVKDFWGDGYRKKNEEYYFEIASSRLCRDNQEVVKLVKAAKERADDLKFEPDGSNSQAEWKLPFEVKVSLNSTTDSLAAFSLDTNNQQLLLRSANAARSEGFRRLSHQLKGSLQDSLATIASADSGSELYNEGALRLHYRGHMRQITPVKLNDKGTKYRTVVHSPYREEELEPKITVKGDDKQMVDVVFVLDASATMEKKMPKGEAGIPPTRMEIAQKRLRALLQRMHKADEAGKLFRVALVVYGHRKKFAWVRKNGVVELIGARDNENLKAKGWAAWWPNLHPNSDVERVIRNPQPLNFNFCEQLKNTINKLTPWGQTPLFLSVSEAMQCFDDQEQTAERHIIILTDGKNDIYDEASNRDKRKDWFTNLRSIRPKNKDWEIDYGDDNGLGTLEREFADEERKPKITLIAFGSDVNESSFERWKASSLKATVWGAEDADLLQEKLDKWFDENVKLPTFAVNAPPPGRKQSKLLPFNDTWDQTVRKNDRMDFAPGLGFHQVVVQGTTQKVPEVKVKLDGWEDLHLMLDNGRVGWRLYYQDYLEKITSLGERSKYYTDSEATGGSGMVTRRTFRRQNSVFDPDEYVAIAIQPKRDDESGHMRFRVALQKKDRSKQSVAPTYLWAEIQPLDREERPLEKYHACDVKCVKKRNVPVLEWAVKDWPENAPYARIYLWGLFDKGDRGGVLNIPIPFKNSTQSINGTDWTVKFTKDELDGRLLLQLSAEGEAALQTLVVLEGDYDLETAEHRVAHRENRVVHVFRFGTPPEFGINVRLIPNASWKKKDGTWNLRVWRPEIEIERDERPFLLFPIPELELSR